jgi:ubiquinone/menaquinone biosynthesis C-methylase UbiE
MPIFTTAKVRSFRQSIRPLSLAAAILLAGPPALAQLASRAAEEWIKTLDAPARVAAMKIPEMVAALDISPGQRVADIGAGSGAVSGPLAIATGPAGVLYAVDIDKDLLAHIDTRARDQHLVNIKTVLGGGIDPRLPEPVDLAFMNDVLHHVQDRAAFLQKLASYLKRGGRLTIVDYRPGVGPHKAQPELEVSEAEVDGWLRAAGLERSKSVPLFGDRYFLIYRKP